MGGTQQMLLSYWAVAPASNWLLNNLVFYQWLNWNALDSTWSYNWSANSITWDSTNQKLWSWCGSFNGSSSYISYSGRWHSGFGSWYTYSLWWKMPSTLPWADSAPIGTDYFYIRYINWSKRFRVADYSWSVEPVIETANNTAVANTWFHFIATYDGSTLYFYLDNSLVWSSSLPWIWSTGRWETIWSYRQAVTWLYAEWLIDGVWCRNTFLTSDQRDALRNWWNWLPYSSFTI